MPHCPTAWNSHITLLTFLCVGAEAIKQLQPLTIPDGCCCSFFYGSEMLDCFSPKNLISIQNKNWPCGGETHGVRRNLSPGTRFIYSGFVDQTNTFRKQRIYSIYKGYRAVSLQLHPKHTTLILFKPLFQALYTRSPSYKNKPWTSIINQTVQVIFLCTVITIPIVLTWKYQQCLLFILIHLSATNTLNCVGASHILFASPQIWVTKWRQSAFIWIKSFEYGCAVCCCLLGK